MFSARATPSWAHHREQDHEPLLKACHLVISLQLCRRRDGVSGTDGITHASLNAPKTALATKRCSTVVLVVFSYPVSAALHIALILPHALNGLYMSPSAEARP
jgi:hypothetical protein